MESKNLRRLSRSLGLFLAVWLALPAVSSAQEADEDRSWTFRHQSALGVRAAPLGLNVTSDTGFRVPIDYGSDSDLFQGLYFEQGLATGLSPAYLWAGPYVEVLPIAVLQLRASAQYAAYFGSLGYLISPLPTDGSGLNYSIPTINDRDTDEGVAARGMMIRFTATPRLRINRIVFTAETTTTWMNMGIQQGYYEPFHDIVLAPRDRWTTTLPTLGYLFGQDLARTYLLLAARADYTKTHESDVSRLLTGLVFLYKLPGEAGADLVHTLSGFLAINAAHTTMGEETTGRVGAPYIGIQYTLRYR